MMPYFPDNITPLPLQKNIRIYIAGLFVISILSMLCIFAWIRDEHNSSPVSEKYYIKAEKDESWIQKVVGDPVALFTLVLTGFTGGLYLATRALWTATDSLVRGAEETAQRQLRAYISVELSEVQRERKEIIFSVINRGQTPARNISGHLSWHWEGGKQDIPDDFDYIDKSSSDARSIVALAKDQSIPMTFDLPIKELQMAAEGTLFIFCYAHIDYKDIFGNDWATKFCYKITDSSPPYRNSFTIWGPYNDAT